VKVYAREPDVEIVAHTVRVHAVREKTLGLLGANFWTAGPNRAGPIRCRGRASLMLGESAKGELTLAVADPTHKGESIQIEIARKAKRVKRRSRRIHVERLAPTIRLTVNVKGLRGESLGITLGTAC